MSEKTKIYECPLCRSIVKASDINCPTCGVAFEKEIEESVSNTEVQSSPPEVRMDSELTKNLVEGTKVNEEKKKEVIDETNLPEKALFENVQPKPTEEGSIVEPTEVLKENKVRGKEAVKNLIYSCLARDKAKTIKEVASEIGKSLAYARYLLEDLVTSGGAERRKDGKVTGYVKK